MVNPKKEPGFQEDHKKEHEKERFNQHDLNERAENRMKSTLIRMSQGAQNFWNSMPWPRGSKQSKATSKRSKK